MKKADFIHLHVHSEYSLLDGAIRTSDLIDKAAEFNMPAVAVTDHGNLYGAVDFYTKAMEKGIKPLIGSEFYMVKGSRHKKSGKSGKSSLYHLTILAENNTGHKKLNKLSSISFIEGFYYKPRIDFEALSECAEGLIGFSGCLKGLIPQLLLEGKEKEAYEQAGKFEDIFGKGNFYIELMDHGLKEQKKVNPMLIKLARDLSIPLIATNDCHYLEKADAEFQDMLICIQTRKKVQDRDRMKFSSQEFYFKSPDEMRELFSEVPDAVSNSVEIAERCHVKMNFQKSILPSFELPPEYTGVDFLKKLTDEGLQNRLEQNGINEAEQIERYKRRLEKELEIIIGMGFAEYFLIVWDIINYAKRNNIPVGPGRGSAAASLVSYTLGITDLDPLKYDLVFERFLNPERVSMPDIDIDFCKDKREKVIQYVVEKYGHSHVAQIITFGTMAARAVIRDVGRVMDFSYSEVDRIAKLVPETLKISIKDALKQEPELKRMMSGDDRVDKLIKASMALEGLARHCSTHAAAVVISKEALTDYVPLAYDPKSESNLALTQYSMDYISKIGLLKIDFLGLRNLTIIDKAVKIIEKTKNITLNPNEIPLDDKKTYELLGRGETVGVFQLESGGMREYLIQLKPNKFEDLIAMVALYRPGPMEWIGKFIDGKYGKAAVEYPHNLLEPILKSTYGVAVYQEQVLQMTRAIAGFSYGEADILRKVISKKKTEELVKQKAKFVKGAAENGIDTRVAEKIFSFIEPFAGYGFNKAHAACYAYIAFQTAYLKTNFPLEYMAALMASDMGNTDKIVNFINECRNMNIRILPPDVNESLHDFTVVGNAVRFGLAAVKNVGDAAIESIIESRKKDGKYESLFDFCERVNLKSVNRRVIESLIKCGAFDSFGAKRSQLIAILDRAMSIGQKFQKDRELGQRSLFGGFSFRDETVDRSLPDMPEWSKSELLSAEKESVGFYITGHPLLSIENELKHYVHSSSKQLKELEGKAPVRLAGIISKLRKLQSKKGELMAFAMFEDLEGLFEVMIPPSLFKEVRHLLSLEKPLITKGYAEKNDKGITVVAEKIITLEEARQMFLNRITINLPVSDITSKNLDQLREIFQDCSGECPVYFNLCYPPGNHIKNVLMEVCSDFHVDPGIPDLFNKIENAAGSDVVRFN